MRHYARLRPNQIMELGTSLSPLTSSPEMGMGPKLGAELVRGIDELEGPFIHSFNLAGRRG